MSRVEETLRKAIGELRRIRAEFALIGGFAVSLRSEPRLTRDVDCAVSVADDREAEGYVRSLLASGWRMAAQVEQDATRRLATVRVQPAGEPGVLVDLLFASSGIESEIVRDADELLVLPGASCKVARVSHLLALKVLARDDRNRPQDRADLGALLRVATPQDLDVARRSLQLIAQRGFGRGKDLIAEFDRARAELA